MKRKLFLIMAICFSALMITGCSDSGDGTPSETSSTVQTEKSQSETDAVPFSETVGVWTYNDEFVFHSGDGKRYLLAEDNSGAVQSTEGKSYSVQECDYRLYHIMNLTDSNLTVSEGRYFEAALNSNDYPDGYKKVVITYDKSDLFDIDALEKAVGGESVSAETSAETQTETASETAAAEETSAPETETVTETEQEQSETETSAPADEDTSTAENEDAEYAAIYKKLEDFLETDNYKQKDAGNRSLEVFNYLHNLADSNIEESSITNDTAKNEVSFRCYEKYTITVNNTDGTITVDTES
ncbi:MAG: hypothetical protein IJ644_02450 [Oscillospiraceae bacterium]|nr:hypothetical protein [Oscillospiraceae bacterium]